MAAFLCALTCSRHCPCLVMVDTCVAQGLFMVGVIGITLVARRMADGRYHYEGITLFLNNGDYCVSDT